jgi:hypothetical protein
VKAALSFRPARGRFNLLTVYGFLAILALGIARFVPVARLFHPWWGCPFRRTTGIPCMGCGLTRAFDWEAHGQVLRAFRLTPLGALAPLLCAGVAVYGILVLLFDVPVPEVKLDASSGRVLRVALVVAVLSNWAYMIATRTRA